MPLRPDELAARSRELLDRMRCALDDGERSAATAEREEASVCLLATATLLLKYPCLDVCVEPSRRRSFIGMIDAAITPSPGLVDRPLAVRVVVNDELARGDWREAVDAIVETVVEAVELARSAPAAPFTTVPNRRGNKPT